MKTINFVKELSVKNINNENFLFIEKGNGYAETISIDRHPEDAVNLLWHWFPQAENKGIVIRYEGTRQFTELVNRLFKEYCEFR
jgi:hypothetical protein